MAVRLPTTTVLLARLQVFEPSRRPEKLLRQAKTSWGMSHVQGRLGQGHADLLELICFLGRDPVPQANGGICVTVDEYQLRQALGRSVAGTGSEPSKWLLEIMDATLELHPKGWGAPISGKLIDEVRRSAKTIPAIGRYTEDRQRSGTRHLTDIVIGSLLVKLMEDDVCIDYDPRLIFKCKKGTPQALVRYCKTHRAAPNGGWKLATVLTHIGASGNAVDVRNRRRELKACDAYLREFNIRVENDRVFL